MGKKYDKFDLTSLEGKSDVYLWSALTLHGTRASNSSKPRVVALRYSLKEKQKQKNSELMKYTKILNNYISKIQQDQISK